MCSLHAHTYQAIACCRCLAVMHCLNALPCREWRSNLASKAADAPGCPVRPGFSPKLLNVHPALCRLTPRCTKQEGQSTEAHGAYNSTESLARRRALARLQGQSAHRPGGRVERHDVDQAPPAHHGREHGGEGAQRGAPVLRLRLAPQPAARQGLCSGVGGLKLGLPTLHMHSRQASQAAAASRDQPVLLAESCRPVISSMRAMNCRLGSVRAAASLHTLAQKQSVMCNRNEAPATTKIHKEKGHMLALRALLKGLCTKGLRTKCRCAPWQPRGQRGNPSEEDEQVCRALDALHRRHRALHECARRAGRGVRRSTRRAAQDARLARVPGGAARVSARGLRGRRGMLRFVARPLPEGAPAHKVACALAGAPARPCAVQVPGRRAKKVCLCWE